MNSSTRTPTSSKRDVKTVYKEGRLVKVSVDRFDWGHDFEQERLRRIEAKRQAQKRAIEEEKRRAYDATLHKFTDVELDAEQKKWFEKGRQQGVEDARQSDEKIIQSFLQNFMTHLSDYVLRNRDYETDLTKTAINLSVDMLTSFYQHLGTEAKQEALQALAQESIEQAPEGQRLVLHLAPTDYDLVAKRLEQWCQEQTHFDWSMISVQKEPTLSTGDMRLAWDQGGVDSIAGRLQANLEALRDQLLAMWGTDAPKKGEALSDINAQPETEDSAEDMAVDAPVDKAIETQTTSSDNTPQTEEKRAEETASQDGADQQSSEVNVETSEPTTTKEVRDE